VKFFYSPLETASGPTKRDWYHKLPQTQPKNRFYYGGWDGMYAEYPQMCASHGNGMTSRLTLRAAIVVIVLFPILALGQETPKVEAFGGYSYLGLSRQPRLGFESADLNGWKASVKFNLTQRIGLLADFSGHYGQLALTPRPNGLSLGSVSRRQHTYLFGLETRILTISRIRLNGRALMGVAQANNSALPQLIPPIASSVFAAAIGASVDYRITDRLSYRIFEPELLVTRFGSSATNAWQHYNFRLSSGLVFTSGSSTPLGATGRRLSFGVVGGAALTDAFGHESGGFIRLPDGGTQPTRFRSYSTRKDYLIGPKVDVDLNWRGMSLEVGALYRLMSLTMASVRPDGSVHSVSPATVVTWEFPVLAKYRVGGGSTKPFIELGPSFRASGTLNGSSPSPYGATAGFGVETRFLGLKIAPVLRYTHWAADPDYTASRTKRNQLEALIGVSF
jgi:hypothetical protein